MSIFKDKVAIVTGAGSGIGQALGENLARQGAIVVLADINADRVNGVVEKIVAAGGQATGLSLDVRDADAVAAMVDEAVTQHGRLDYMFNNAGIGVGGPCHDCCIEDWRNVIDINLYGVVNGVAAAYPLMIKQGCGHIVNTASVEGLCPFAGTAAYVASKYGVVGLSHTLRMEGPLYGVKVSVVCPGYVTTRIFEDAKLVGIDRDAMLGAMPPAWLGVTPEKCAEVILKGVVKNKATIVVTHTARLMWAINRLSSSLWQFMGTIGFSMFMKRLAKQGATNRHF